MFRVNQKRLRINIFGLEHQFPAGMKNKLENSWAPAFRKLVFEKIEEKRYAVLYSTIESRPNFPVNIWVLALALYGRISFNLPFRLCILN